MALSLLSVNMCQFNDCGLYFANLHDLLQHVEEIHIIEVEKDLMRKDELSQQLSMSDESPTKSSLAGVSAATLPLSIVYRLFKTLPTQKAQPVKYEPLKISFCHYRKKLTSSNAANYGLMSVGERSFRSEHDDESSDSYKNDEFDDYEHGGDTMDERRHKCPVEGCNKRYKNLQGARYHARQVHAYSEDAANSAVDFTSVIGGQLAPLMQIATSSRYANSRPYKCSQCSKRYKTIIGLNNHVQQSHARVNIVTPAQLTQSPLTGNSMQLNAQSDKDVTAVSSYMSSPLISNIQTVGARTTVQSVLALSTTSGQQYQQQHTRVLTTSASPQTKNMNMLSSYGPQAEMQNSSYLYTQQSGGGTAR